MFNVLRGASFRRMSRVVYFFIISYCMQVKFLLDLNAHILQYSHMALSNLYQNLALKIGNPLALEARKDSK